MLCLKVKVKQSYFIINLTIIMHRSSFVFFAVIVVHLFVVATSKSQSLNEKQNDNHYKKRQIKSRAENKHEELNSNAPDLPGHFIPKTKKATLIWQKALKKHEGNTELLESLAKELMLIDKKLLQLKKHKYEDKDPYGDAENILEKQIQVLLEKYGMMGNVPADGEIRSNRVKDYLQKEDKFERMYIKAQQLGFSETELQDLKEEIFHHKRTMAELDELVGTLQAMEENMRVVSNLVDERVAEEHKDAIINPKKVLEIRTAIKRKEEEVGKGFSRLSLMSDNPGLPENSTFTQVKVLKLWMGILKSNFTQEERESLKEELMHLEKKMNKRDRLREEQAILEKQEKSINPSHAAKKEKYVAKLEKYEEKTKHLDKHLNKYVRSLKDKISERMQRTEL